MCGFVFWGKIGVRQAVRVCLRSCFSSGLGGKIGVGQLYVCVVLWGAAVGGSVCRSNDVCMCVRLRTHAYIIPLPFPPHRIVNSRALTRSTHPMHTIPPLPFPSRHHHRTRCASPDPIDSPHTTYNPPTPPTRTRCASRASSAWWPRRRRTTPCSSRRRSTPSKGLPIGGHRGEGWRDILIKN